MSPTSAVCDWHIARLFQQGPAAEPYGLIILNQPLRRPATLARLWENAAFRVAADGGANRLYDARTADRAFTELDAIIGDLDSLRENTRSYFCGGSSSSIDSSNAAKTNTTQPRTELVHDPDQYSTDFGKAVRLIRARHPRLRSIVALGGLGGRVDQGVSQLHHLYLFSGTAAAPAGKAGNAGQPEQQHRLYMVSSESLTFLLSPGRHRLHVRLAVGDEAAAPPKPHNNTDDVFAKHVGVLPMQGPSVISMRGFEWDVADWPTQFGGQLSTSNHVLPDVTAVEVDTDRAVVFTIALKQEGD